MAKASIGTAWINIKPSLDGVKNSIQGQLRGTGTSISSDLGGEIAKSSAIGTAVGNVLFAAASKVAGKIANVIGGVMNDAVDRMDAITRASNALEKMGYSADDVKSKMSQLRDNAKVTAANIGDLSDSFLALTGSWKDMDLTADATQALSDAILSFGGTPDQVANAITQISQVPLDGPLDAQTWLSLRNSGLIPVLGTIAEMNGMDLGQFKEALGKGEITTHQLVDQLIRLDKEGVPGMQSLEEIAKSNAAATWSGSWETARNAVVDSVTEAMDSIWQASGAGEKIITVGDGIAQAIDGINKKGGALERIKDFIQPLVQPMKQLGDGVKKLFEGVSKVMGAISTSVIDRVKATITSIVNNPQVQDFFTRLGDIFGRIGELLSHIGEKMQEVWTSIQPYIQPVVDFLVTVVVGAINMVISVIQTIIAIVAPIISTIIDIVSGAVSSILDVCRPFFEFFMQAFTKIFNFASEVVTGIQDFFTKAWDKISEVWGVVSEFFKKIFENAKRGIEEKFGPIVQWFKDRWEDIKNVFSTVRQLGKDIVEGLWNGINDMVGWIKEKISGFSESVLNGIKEFFGIHSPSKVMRDQVGVMLGRGMAEGITASTSYVTSAMSGLGDAALNEMAALDSNLANGLSANATLSTNFGDYPNARVVQNNVFNVHDNFDLQQISSDLGYAVATA